MDDNTVSITVTEYKRLLQNDAKVQSFMDYVNSTKRSVDCNIMVGILGFFGERGG